LAVKRLPVVEGITGQVQCGLVDDVPHPEQANRSTSSTSRSKPRISFFVLATETPFSG
jgi:hypothetical protein